VPDAADQLDGLVDAQLDPDLRELVVQLSDGSSDYQAPGKRTDSHAIHGSIDAFHAPDLPIHGFRVSQQRNGVRGEDLPGVRRRAPATTPIEQLSPGSLFEPPNPAGRRRLRDTEFPGGGGEGPGARQQPEVGIYVHM
jgi:hypothetical protein